VLSGNVITDDRSSAVGFEGDRNTFRNNRIQRAAAAGVNFRGRGNQITRNVVTDIPAFAPGFGIDFSGGDDRIAGNQTSRTLNQAIRLNVFENETASTAHRTTVVGNVVRGAGTVGIAISTDFEGSGTIDGTFISGNAVIAAGADGIQVVSPGATLKRTSSPAIPCMAARPWPG